MPATEVSSVVDSILEAFRNGLDIFARIRGKKQKKRNKPSKVSLEELRLQDSLTNRPIEIKSEYTQSVVKYGKRFEKGDTQAYSSLAHTLLVLNTGLINLINSALSSDALDPSKSRQSLLMLSESAAANTMQALSQLNLRLLPSLENIHPTDRTRHERKKSKQPPSPKLPARPPPSPLLARGGWVRSRSGSSVVTAASARKATTSNGDHSRSLSAPGLSESAKDREGSTGVPGKLLSFESEERQCTCRNHPSPAEQERRSTNVPQNLMADAERPVSMILVPADYFETSGPTEIEPNHSHKPAPYARHNSRTRARPPSAATFLTASTRIGEIPEHKWVDQMLSAEESAEVPLPYVIPPPLQSPQKKRKGIKFWKKSVGNEMIIAD